MIQHTLFFPALIIEADRILMFPLFIIEFVFNLCNTYIAFVGTSFTYNSYMNYISKLQNCQKPECFQKEDSGFSCFTVLLKCTQINRINILQGVFQLHGWSVYNQFYLFGHPPQLPHPPCIACAVRSNGVVTRQIA